jgi:hypothetical protein
LHVLVALTLSAHAVKECRSQLFDFLEQYCHDIDRNDAKTWDAPYFKVPTAKDASKSTTLRRWPKGGQKQGFLNVYHLPFQWKNREVRCSNCSLLPLSPLLALSESAGGLRVRRSAARARQSAIR